MKEKRACGITSKACCMRVLAPWLLGLVGIHQFCHVCNRPKYSNMCDDNKSHKNIRIQFMVPNCRKNNKQRERDQRDENYL
ncbi:hypothetical protein [Ammoniphilus sp. 3BR4]|uniref:hypothetical protein n=1 Tax=Ammoniphilus sp. 3BR4 TaxID=3158265 RepID=UPI003466EEA4